MFGKIVRVFGIMVVILISTTCIFFSMMEREMDITETNPTFSKILNFPGIFEDRFYDWRMRKTLSATSYDDRLVLVKIDDASLQSSIVGRWPFTRVVWAKFMHKMQAFGAKVVAYDVFFAEPEKSCNNTDGDPDHLLAESIRNFQTRPGHKVILPYSLNVDGQKTDREFKDVPEALFNFVCDTRQAKDLNLKVMSISKDAYPIPALIQTEAGLGHIEASPDNDGIYRHYQFISNVDDLYFPSYGLMAYQYFTEDKPILELLAQGEYQLKTKKGSILLNQNGEAKVRWFGEPRAYPDLSLMDVISARDDDSKMIQKIKGKIIFIGSTAFGANDFRHTPIDPQMS
ncbi:MAG: CHASE2 domain-containing protein, partial [Bdellovibrionota bacterium]